MSSERQILVNKELWHFTTPNSPFSFSHHRFSLFVLSLSVSQIFVLNLASSRRRQPRHLTPLTIPRPSPTSKPETVMEIGISRSKFSGLAFYGEESQLVTRGMGQDSCSKPLPKRFGYLLVDI